MATGYGFKIHTASGTQELVKCIHLVGDAVLLGKGDAVKLAANSVKIGNGPVVQAVARAATGDKIFGIVEGVEQHTVASGMSLDRTYCPASTAMYLLVRRVYLGDLYSVQEDADGGAIATTAVGLNANFIVANANTTTGMSGTMLDSSTAATTNTHDLHIRGFVDEVNNTPAQTAGAKIVVSFNNVQEINQVAGV
jgi:hypothetical protein